jgi:hypothetical protein
VRKVCGSGRNYDTHTHTHSLSLTLWPNKEMLKKNLWFFLSLSLLPISLSLYVYISIYTHMRTHKIWQCGLRLIALEETLVPSPCYSTQCSRRTYTQTNTRQLVLHPTPSSTRFKSRRGNLNTEFHIFLRNVCLSLQSTLVCASINFCCF